MLELAAIWRQEHLVRLKSNVMAVVDSMDTGQESCTWMYAASENLLARKQGKTVTMRTLYACCVSESSQSTFTSRMKSSIAYLRDPSQDYSEIWRRILGKGQNTFSTWRCPQSLSSLVNAKANYIISTAWLQASFATIKFTAQFVTRPTTSF